jgi:ParB family chromosome partitioning protein
LIENIQRENLNPLEEANAFQRLIIEYEMTHQEVANAVGRARASISNILRLLELPSAVQDLVNESKISMGHARAMLAIKDRSMQLEVANLVVEKNLSVRETEALVRGILEGKERKKTTKPKDNDIVSLEKELSEKLGAKVAIQHASTGKGRLTISYSSVDELEGILERIK